MNLDANKQDAIPKAISQTTVVAVEYNQIAGSLMSLVNGAGLTPDASDNDQILNAVKTLAAPTEITDLASTSITLANAAANTVYKYGTLTSLTITAKSEWLTGERRSLFWALPIYRAEQMIFCQGLPMRARLRCYLRFRVRSSE